MNYYINSGAGKRKTPGKIILYVLGYAAAFALSFFISFKLVASTRTDTMQVQSLKEQISALNVQLADKEERISSLELQLKSLQSKVEEQASVLAAVENPPSEEVTP